MALKVKDGLREWYKRYPIYVGIWRMLEEFTGRVIMYWISASGAYSNGQVGLQAYGQRIRGEKTMSNLERRIRLRRAYEEPEASDGTRVLVDRLWPRGLSKERARVDLWLKEIAPSNELRHWFGHDPEKFAEFRHRYEAELASEPAQEAIVKLRQMAKRAPLTLLFAAHDSEHCNAAVLYDLLMHSDALFNS